MTTIHLQMRAQRFVSACRSERSFCSWDTDRAVLRAKRRDFVLLPPNKNRIHSKDCDVASGSALQRAARLRGGARWRSGSPSIPTPAHLPQPKKRRQYRSMRFCPTLTTKNYATLRSSAGRCDANEWSVFYLILHGLHTNFTANGGSSMKNGIYHRAITKIGVYFISCLQ
jgi:hypothetical protein